MTLILWMFAGMYFFMQNDIVVRSSNCPLYGNKQRRVMECIDQINTRHGHNTAAFAATGLHKQEDHRNKCTMSKIT